MDSPAPSGYTWALDEVTVTSVAEGWPSPVEGVRLEIGPRIDPADPPSTLRLTPALCSCGVGPPRPPALNETERDRVNPSAPTNLDLIWTCSNPGFSGGVGTPATERGSWESATAQESRHWPPCRLSSSVSQRAPAESISKISRRSRKRVPASPQDRRCRGVRRAQSACGVERNPVVGCRAPTTAQGRRRARCWNAGAAAGPDP
jgi:hypothetical protein